jgi:ketosteroid isomerase-like protein
MFESHVRRYGMKLRFLLLVSSLAFPIVAMSQPENPEIRKEIGAVYKKFDEAYSKKDIDGMMALLHGSYMHVDPNGFTSSKAQMRKAQEEALRDIHSIKSKCVVNAIFDHGSEVVAWITMTVHSKFDDGENLISSSFTIRFADTLVRTPKGWRIIYSQVLPD